MCKISWAALVSARGADVRAWQKVRVGAKVVSNSVPVIGSDVVDDCLIYCWLRTETVNVKM